MPTQAKSPKFSGAFASILNPTKDANAPLAGSAGNASDEIARERFLNAIRSPAPGQWMSGHLDETNRLRGAVYVALKVLADAAASAELKAYKWHEDARLADDQDAREPLPRSHGISRLMLRPNVHDSGAMLRRKIVQQLGLTGSAYLWQVTDGLDVPRESWSVPTAVTQPVPISGNYPNGGFRVLPYFPSPLAMIPGVYSAGGIVVDAAHIAAIRYPHPLLIGSPEGLSPMSAASLPLDALESVDRARFTQARKQSAPSAIVELDPNQAYPDEILLARIQAQLRAALATPDKFGAVAILGPGQKLSEGWARQQELAFAETWTQLVGFVLSIWGLNRIIAFMESATSYAALYSALRQVSLLTIQPLLDLIADAINSQVVERHWGIDYCIELKAKKIDDEQLTEQQLAEDDRCGLRTVNERRVGRGLPKVPWGDVRCFSGSQATKEEEATQEPQAGNGDSKSDPEIEKDRPTPGKLGEGSLGVPHNRLNGVNGHANGTHA